MKKQLLAFSITLASAVSFAQTPRLTLFEEFTGETCGPCAATNPALNDTLRTPWNTQKCVSIKWQVPIPSTPQASWSLYKKNITEISQRAAYYPSQNGTGQPITNQINSAPQGRFDGQHQWTFGAASDHPGNVKASLIATAQSYTSAFSLTLAKELVSGGAAYNLTINIVATAPFSAAGPLVFRTVMVDKLIEFSQPPGTTSEKTFEDVAVKSFPSLQAGIGLPGTWTVGQIRTYTLNCPIPAYILNEENERSPANLDFVGFIQDNGNKKVAQAVRASYCTFVYAYASKNQICEPGETVTLTGDGADSFAWSTGQTSGNIAVTPTETTTYWIESTDPNSCQNRSAVTVSVGGCTGVNELSNKNFPVEIYPNPNKGDFLIKAGFANTTTSMVIFNALGQKVFEQKLTAGETSIKTNLNKGLYNYQVLEGTIKVNTGKLVIE